MVESIASILKNKGSAIHSVSPAATAREAIAVMAAQNIAAVLVMERGALIGIVSAKDYGVRVVLQGKKGTDALARDVMTSPVVVVAPDVKVTDAMQIMTTKKIRHLPVLSNDDVVGVVTLGDLARALVADQEHKIDELMKYVGHK